jgi:hypothetical protein
MRASGQSTGSKVQEAPIVIYSMTTSSVTDAPRGMSFLYSPNRLNVATSRARCLAVVVASPLLFMPECRTPDQMRLANAFCRLRSWPGMQIRHWASHAWPRALWDCGSRGAIFRETIEAGSDKCRVLNVSTTRL